MIKRAKDVTYTNILVTDEGLMEVKAVDTDMEITEIKGAWGAKHTFGAYDMVETLNDFDSLDA
ncbi:hypothetical protein [Streptomyces lavendulae]|uniref:hypothetical protein n=1 Tax=Streptomyces lavendulae TaxID=1914 RepID=UPI0036B4AD3F